MAPSRKLPDDDEVVALKSTGMSNREIGEKFGTTGEAVRQALARIGYVDTSKPTHAFYIPWTVRADHTGHLLVRRLRSYSKRQQGKSMSETENRLLDEWTKWMDGGNTWGVPMSVHYDRNDDEGFWLDPRRPGDRDYISLEEMS